MRARRLLPALEFLCGQSWHLLGLVHRLAEQLAGHVAALGQCLPAVLPGTHAAGQGAHLAVAQPRQGECGARGARIAFAAVVHHDVGVAPWHQLGDAQFDLPARQEARPVQVAAMRLAGLAHVEQRELLRCGRAQREQFRDFQRGDGRVHTASIRHAGAAPQRLATDPGLNFRRLKSKDILLRCDSPA